ncbi:MULTISPECIES: hypothetical protein [Enterobacterales]|uniref:hypothetical protein n=1 Tax=Enterobacterales TaxID=91347 RepID=UPI000847F050|nr:MULTISPECIES: hypothetical protein [Enterobacterales]WOO50194.1 hypothetical protein R2S03_03100 [Hafnia alvei]MCT6516365.1 hypothetical protein [Proteus vulgaris]ODQ02650.1 hypothetical protein BGK50_09200 [Shigella sp. FC130]OEI90936.1 hypothetical protein BHE86_09720 [Shigella sp. FC1655]WPF04658.1 hypothetical protein SB028_01945 [Proteus vulgaris]
MKKILFFILISISLGSFANDKEYSDKMASYAAIFEFSPIKGNIESAVQVFNYDTESLPFQGIRLSLSPNGCIDAIEMIKKTNENNEDRVKLYRINNNLVFNKDIKGKFKEEMYLLDSSCNIIKDLKNNINYTYENNLINTVTKNGEIIKRFKFNNKNQLTDIIFNKLIQPKNDMMKLLTNTDVECTDFDINKNPLTCSTLSERSNSSRKLIMTSIYNYYE